MAKQSKRNPSQVSFFKKAIPQMPEGYYSSGPNPNLRRFVEEHAKPYDPATDKYNVPPFDQPITTTKATAIYNMHTYWSKKPHDAIRQYIRHYTQPGDIVLDPFCGSGGTALAALMEGRAAIAIDLSPAATFITKNYCTPVDADALQSAFETMYSRVKPEIDWLYKTRCDRCEGRATVGYTIYSYTFQCPRCLNKVPLFDCVEVDGLTNSGKPRKVSVCPNCYAYGHEEEISTSDQRFSPIPVLVSYLCEEGCIPKRAERRHNDRNPKKREYFEKYDLGKISEIDNKKIPHRFPTSRMMYAPDDHERWGILWRPYLRNVENVNDLYTKRNLWALSAIHESIQLEPNIQIRDSMLFAFNSIVLINSRMCDAFNTQISKGTYYTPPIFKEIRPDNSISGKVDLICEADQERGLVTTDLCISTDTSTSLKIPNNSVDYIFTDPPYSWKVQFGEANFVWEAWLGFDSHWLEREIIINDVRGKSEREWAYLMQEAMSECFRVLKPNRWISLCYHDTSEGTWALIQDIMAEIGFVSEESERVIFIDTDQKSWKQNIADKVTKRDLVINFRKPLPREVSAQLELFDENDFESFQDIARFILSEALTSHPGTSADRLYDELVSRTVRKGVFERHNFDALLRSVAEEAPPGSGRWYLLETAGVVDEAESKKEEAAAKKLEQFMLKQLSGDRGLGDKGGIPTPYPLSPDEGVHYSDLFEAYLPVKDKPRRLLQEWLPEYFFKTIEGTWRPSLSDEERAQKAALRSSGALRRIKRFANALVEGVPPYEKDRPENAATLADWIRQCRRAGLYELGRVLYEKGGLRFEGLGEAAQMEVEEDYQVCVKRGAKMEKGKKAKGKGSQQPSLFEAG